MTIEEAIRRIRLSAKILVRGYAQPGQPRETISSISPEEVAEARQFFPMEKFFIFGHARSGTTLLARLVRVHPKVHCNWQAHFFTRPPLLNSLVANPDVSAWLARRSNRWNRGGDLSPVVLRAVSDYILERDARQAGKRITGDKSPNSLLDGHSVHLLHDVYPDARLIFIVRDGRDAVLSHRFQTFIDATHHMQKSDFKIMNEYIRDAQPFLQGERSVFTEKGIRRAAEGWAHNVNTTEQAGKDLFGDRFITLRYEDLLEHAWQQMGRIWSFLDADVSLPDLENSLAVELDKNPDADWQRQKAGEIAQNLQKGQRGSWREMFTGRDRQIFHDIAGATLRTWGYRLE
jgi:hypothetical protein